MEIASDEAILAGRHVVVQCLILKQQGIQLLLEDHSAITGSQHNLGTAELAAMLGGLGTKDLSAAVFCRGQGHTHVQHASQQQQGNAVQQPPAAPQSLAPAGSPVKGKYCSIHATILPKWCLPCSTLTRKEGTW